MKLDQLSRAAARSTEPRMRMLGLGSVHLAWVKGSVQQQVNCTTVCARDEYCPFYPADDCPRPV